MPDDRKEAEQFSVRHIGPSPDERKEMLAQLGYSSLRELSHNVVPQQIQMDSALALTDFPLAESEVSAIARLRETARKNAVARSFIGMGYSGCITPPVIQRNILENPGWYTQYTPYQPEISQGRLEALLNFQTMVSDLTGLPIANASLLDEGTAAAEAMTMSHALRSKSSKAASKYYVADTCHPQTISVVHGRADAIGIEVVVAPVNEFQFDDSVIGALIQYPCTYGAIQDPRTVIQNAQSAGALVTLATDLLALAAIESPGVLGADIAIGNSQRFGVPMGFGGPHAAFIAAKDDFKRSLPGRLVGISKDSEGRPALRLALQTREQHIRREKATSNICTAQVLLAIMAGMYAVYHGPRGIQRIADRVHGYTARLATSLKAAGYALYSECFFDTITVALDQEKATAVVHAAEHAGYNLRKSEIGVSIALDETVSDTDLAKLLSFFSAADSGLSSAGDTLGGLKRSDSFLNHPVFSMYHSETEFLRYVRRLESKDLSLGTAMIPLGSCTMKLNATSEMLPVTWPEFASLHPFVPAAQAAGYRVMFDELERSLAEMTGFAAVSLQPNAGSQGEYAGLLVIRAYHRDRGEAHRTVCLIPKSAHGTNPASAVMAGMQVVVVACDENGNVDLEDLRAKAAQHKEKLSALMVTYPSTHGVFEEDIKEICDIVHAAGGQVYMDGANFNALVGLARPASFGADVMHFNLHKTFCIPHGGGGPGMGPIGVADHLAPYLPGHPVVNPQASAKAIEPVSAAPWGSPSILPISWMYIAMMAADGLTEATEVAILNANYIASRLDPYYPVLFKGKNGLVAHECILDLRALKESAGVEVEDVAKRLMDYGFHAPTISWPVIGTMMVEPTESESKAEIDRFCDAMISIRKEIEKIETGKWPKDNNPLKNAPHTTEVVVGNEWERPYTREEAAFPEEYLRYYKFWPAVGRIEAAYGDRNLICTCPTPEDFE